MEERLRIAPKEAEHFEFPENRAALIQDRRDGHCWYRVPLGRLPGHHPTVITIYELGCRRSTIEAERHIRSLKDCPDIPIDRYSTSVELGHLSHVDERLRRFYPKGCEDAYIDAADVKAKKAP